MLDALHHWLLLQCQQVPDGSATAKALGYSLRRWVALTRFADDGHDPYAYLKDVLTRLPTHKASRIDELLPHRWQPTDI